LNCRTSKSRRIFTVNLTWKETKHPIVFCPLSESHATIRPVGCEIDSLGASICASSRLSHKYWIHCDCFVSFIDLSKKFLTVPLTVGDKIRTKTVSSTNFQFTREPKRITEPMSKSRKLRRLGCRHHEYRNSPPNTKGSVFCNPPYDLPENKPKFCPKHES